MTEQEIKAVIESVYELGLKTQVREKKDDDYFKQPSPEAIARIKKFAREFKKDDHDTAILRDRVTELQETCKQYSLKLRENNHEIERLQALVKCKEAFLTKEKEDRKQEYESLITQLNEEKEKVIMAEHKAKTSELSNEEIDLINRCRSVSHGTTIINHSSSGWSIDIL